jgi:type I restriction enzyme R subunit
MTPPGSAAAPEAQARLAIDARLVAAGWVIQDRDTANLGAGRGVAIREFKLAPPHGFADYLLFVDGQACGVLEAKAWGHTLSGVEPQADRYARPVEMP